MRIVKKKFHRLKLITKNQSIIDYANVEATG
jgi:hypothetical protein